MVLAILLSSGAIVNDFSNGPTQPEPGPRREIEPACSFFISSLARGMVEIPRLQAK
jgi:hypothetical protein